MRSLIPATAPAHGNRIKPQNTLSITLRRQLDTRLCFVCLSRFSFEILKLLITNYSLLIIFFYLCPINYFKDGHNTTL